MSTKDQKQNAVSKEVAVKEIQDFVFQNESKKLEEWEVEKNFGNLLMAIIDGNVVFEKNHPKMTLRESIKNDKGEVAVSEIEFRSRVKPSDLREIAKGLNVSEQSLTFVHKCYSYITGQPMPILDKMCKQDFKTIEQICQTFL